MCVCKAIKSQEISEVIHSGKRTVEEIGQSCGAGTDCGSCVRRLQRFLDAQLSESQTQEACKTELDSREAG